MARVADSKSSASANLHRALPEETIPCRCLSDGSVSFDYRSIFDFAGIGLVITAADGRFLDVNQHFCSMLGYTRDELLAKSVIEVTHPDDTVLSLKLLRQVRQGGQQQVQTLKRYLRSDGSTLYCKMSATAINDCEGRHCCNLTVIQDMTRARHADEALRQSQRMMATLLSNLPGLVYRCRNDSPWTMEFVSDGCGELTGYKPADLLFNKRVSYADVIHPDDRQDVWEMCQLAIAERRPFQLRYRIITAGGATKWVWEQGQGVYSDNGALLALEGFIMDISDRIQAEKELQQTQLQFLHAQKMEAIGRLAGGVAHDFNNLLSAILGYSDFVAGGLSAESPLFDDVTQIKQAAQAAARLTRQLLAFSRKHPVEPQPINLSDLIGGMRKMLARLLGENISVVTEGTGAPHYVWFDPGQMEQVLLNLVVNARDAMSDGGILHISVETKDLMAPYSDGRITVPAGRHVVLSVRDTGNGMSEGVKSHIFEPFFTTKEEGKGTGLGLATVYGIVRQAGGHITLDSVPDMGTTFRIFLPELDSVSEEAVQTNEASARTGGGETILVVEDDPRILALTTRILQGEGYKLITASGAAAARRLAREHQGAIDLLITDIVMPGGNGRELHTELCKQMPQLRTLFVSGYPDEIIGQHGTLENGLYLLSKPFTPQQLKDRVRKVLDE